MPLESCLLLLSVTSPSPISFLEGSRALPNSYFFLCRFLFLLCVYGGGGDCLLLSMLLGLLLAFHSGFTPGSVWGNIKDAGVGLVQGKSPVLCTIYLPCTFHSFYICPNSIHFTYGL